MDTIEIRGARTHNLKDISLTIPRDKLIVITGLSGSGKSSLAFDTLYAEGQRRYVESLSAYARQFLSLMEKPDLDHIEGLSPAISIEQKSTSHNPRSTVGTVTEIYDYLRLLYARAGEPRCPEHQLPLEAQTVSQIVDQIMALKKESKVAILAPLIKDRKGEYKDLFDKLKSQGYVRIRLNGKLIELSDVTDLDAKLKHNIEVVVDRVKIRQGLQIRLAESIETTLDLSEGVVRVISLDDDNIDMVFSARFACPVCGHSIPELEPRIFSFNNPAGACSDCDGLGVTQFIDESRVISDDSKSLSDGAIRGWDSRNYFYFSMIKGMAKHYKFDVEKPWKKLGKKIKDKILYGTGIESVAFRYQNDRGDSVVRRHPFEGVIPNLERRYRETESSSVREELSRLFTKQACPSCHGTRLNENSRNVFVGETSLPALTGMSIENSLKLLKKLKLKGKKGKIAEKILKETNLRLSFLENVGLEYLTLNRSAETLSGGESQRIRLASQIGAGLVGVMYVLDEPSIGLHQRDNARLLKTLTRLRDMGNTVIVVEHDEDAMKAADHIIDIGPGAGVHGGEIVFEGKLPALKRSTQSLTGKYLSGKLQIAIPESVKKPHKEKQLTIIGAKENNLQNLTVNIPIGLFTCITGVSGSGKSTLINETLYPVAAKELNRALSHHIAAHDKIEGMEHLDKVVDIDQSPIGRTPRSNPATYTGIFTPVRELFSATPESRSRGYKPGRFSFNVKGGRCEACQGDGVIKVEMHFLPDVYVPCDLCKGARYNRETLEIHYKGKTIQQVLAMTVEEAAKYFENIPVIKRRLQTLLDVGLGYITLGQSATTLSGGEAQRVKLSRELAKRDTGKTLYILDEPTTGLHFHDIAQLLKVLHRLRDHGNTVIVIEHNLDVIKTADWIIDLGPEGGDKGGKIIAQGSPEKVSRNKKSFTGHYLKPYFEK
ncbi:MAG TPA: excinuclease ABC subunit UvrA [Aeromonadales bacterium]|nr:excinuclease ABC subunit UvrA [Aeromonadales bacterium]